MLIVRTLPPRATRAQQCRCCERRQRRRGRAFRDVVMCVCCPPRTAGRQGEFPLGGGQGRGNLNREAPPPSSVQGQSLRHTRAPQRRSFGAPFTHRAQDVVSIGADSRQCVQAAPCPAAPSPSKPLASAADGVRPPVRPPAADSARSAAPPQRWTTGTRTTATWRAQT